MSQDQNYTKLLENIKKHITQARVQATKMITMYWLIGKVGAYKIIRNNL